MQKREKERDENIRRVHEIRVKGKRNRRHPKHRWKNTIRKDLQSLSDEDVQERIRWKSLTELSGRHPLPVQNRAEIGEKFCKFTETVVTGRVSI